MAPPPPRAPSGRRAGRRVERRRARSSGSAVYYTRSVAPSSTGPGLDRTRPRGRLRGLRRPTMTPNKAATVFRELLQTTDQELGMFARRAGVPAGASFE